MPISRQPIPGQDNQVWGNILNDYLSVSLADDGSLKNGVVADVQIAAGAGIAESKLSLASDAAAGTASRRTWVQGRLRPLPATTRGLRAPSRRQTRIR